MIIDWAKNEAIPYLEQNYEINENTNIIIKLGANDLFGNKEEYLSIHDKINENEDIIDLQGGLRR